MNSNIKASLFVSSMALFFGLMVVSLASAGSTRANVESYLLSHYGVTKDISRMPAVVKVYGKKG